MRREKVPGRDESHDPGQLAVPRGFEPLMQVTPHTRIPAVLLRPLGQGTVGNPTSFAAEVPTEGALQDEIPSDNRTRPIAAASRYSVE